MAKPYTGRNRRWQERRKLTDRRLAIRFDVSKDPRRQLFDRRGSGAWETMFLNR